MKDNLVYLLLLPEKTPETSRKFNPNYFSQHNPLYLIERVPAWTKTDYSRVGRKDKIFFTDTGLMSSVLKWNLEKVGLDGELNGKLLETFVFTQLASTIEAEAEDYSFYHYRDRLNREIDFIIENENGDFLGIEVKSGSAIRSESFKHLEWFRENMASKKNFIGVILYTGEEVVRFGKEMWAVPMSFLWD